VRFYASGRYRRRFRRTVLKSGAYRGDGIFLLAIFWSFTTLMGWRAALRRDFVTHQRWMIRSFALTLVAEWWLPARALSRASIVG
jgi:hypothetical protein